MNDSTILWQGLYWPGHEAALLRVDDRGASVDGTAVLFHDGRACRLDYQLTCDARWQTRHVVVQGWVGAQTIAQEIVVDDTQRWWVNGVEATAVAGCIDIDLNFSPVTNTLPIRRAQLAIGAEIAVTAAWLRFPSFVLEPLDQVYQRRAERHYQYTSGGGSFVAELTVNAAGLVTDYPQLWRAVSAGDDKVTG